MAISKNLAISTDRAEVRITRHVETGWPDSVLVNICGSNHGFTATLHLTIDDAKAVAVAMNKAVQEERRDTLVGVLATLVDVLDGEDLELIANQCGVEVSEFYSAPEDPTDGATISREDYEYGVWRQEQIDSEREAA